MTGSIADQRRSAAWGLLFVALFAMTAPAIAAFAKLIIFRTSRWRRPRRLPAWLTELADSICSSPAMPMATARSGRRSSSSRATASRWRCRSAAKLPYVLYRADGGGGNGDRARRGGRASLHACGEPCRGPLPRARPPPGAAAADRRLGRDRRDRRSPLPCSSSSPTSIRSAPRSRPSPSPARPSSPCCCWPSGGGDAPSGARMAAMGTGFAVMVVETVLGGAFGVRRCRLHDAARQPDRRKPCARRPASRQVSIGRGFARPRTAYCEEMRDPAGETDLRSRAQRARRGRSALRRRPRRTSELSWSERKHDERTASAQREAPHALSRDRPLSHGTAQSLGPARDLFRGMRLAGRQARGAAAWRARRRHQPR